MFYVTFCNAFSFTAVGEEGADFSAIKIQDTRNFILSRYQCNSKL